VSTNHGPSSNIDSSTTAQKRAAGDGRTGQPARQDAAGPLLRNLPSRTETYVLAQPLVPAAIAFATGIAIDRVVPMLAIGAASLFCFAFLARFQNRDNQPTPTSECRWRFPVRFIGYGQMALLFLTIATLGAARHHSHWFEYDANDLSHFATETSEPVVLEAYVRGTPEFRAAPPIDPLRSVPLESRTIVHVQACQLLHQGKWIDVSGFAQLTVNGQLLNVEAGDRLRVLGHFSRPTRAGNPGEFEFAVHLRKNRELTLIRSESPEAVTIAQSGNSWNPMRWLYRARAAGSKYLWSKLSHQQAGLAAAILLGSREQLTEDQYDRFMETGTIHILSISGLHVGILATALFMLLNTGVLSRVPAMITVAVVTGLYTLLSGSEPPAIRATLLVWIVCGAMILGRRSLSFNSLAFAAIVVLVLNPSDLFRTGTQLSFIAMLALMWLAPQRLDRKQLDPLTQLIHRTEPWYMRAGRWLAKYVCELTRVGFVVWLVTTPLVLAQFGLISFSALALNVVLALPVAVAMLSGFGVLTIGWLIPPLGTVFAAGCDWSLWSIEWMVDRAAHWRGSFLWTSDPGIWWLAILYVLLAAQLVVRGRWKPYLTGWRPIVLWIAVGVAVTAIGPANRDDLTCTFLSVGHGNAVVIETPGGKTLLYDAGRLGSPEAAARAVESYLRWRGIRRIDALVISHADIDHYNAVPQLLTRLRVSEVYVTPRMLQGNSPPLQVLWQSIRQAEIPLRTLAKGDTIDLEEGCRFEVLHPPAAGVDGSDNANSIVLNIEHAGRRVLLTGDIEPPAVQTLLDRPRLDCDVMLTPHHGSSLSSPGEFINWCTPEWAVISSERPRSKDQFAEYYGALGNRVLCTAVTGAVQFRISSESIQSRCWLLDRWSRY